MEAVKFAARTTIIATAAEVDYAIAIVTLAVDTTIVSATITIATSEYYVGVDEIDDSTASDLATQAATDSIINETLVKISDDEVVAIIGDAYGV